ncbi:sce7725 family protein [Sporosarcina beigongshangi]|uniref:sce7725 family protein n=1 Tax=Sporosarcina beigongshangi TaxID=2782538 RepID=UPI00193A5F4A|nr:sce7725 family protein [Sporosarcina beigongshangi]
MYFPYLRGRQFELIALRELVEYGLIYENIIPVIEPIKPTSTLQSTLAKFVEFEKKVAVIKNPQVGDFLSEYQDIRPESDLINLMEDPNNHIIQAHIMNPNSEMEIEEWMRNGVNLEGLLIVNTNRDCLSTYKTLFRESVPNYVLIPDSTTFRRSISANRVLFEDRFLSLKEARNADYKDKDEFFSEAHLFYESENYSGFSDFSIVGADFSEGGFAPYAVAIHIVYFGEDEELRVKSFVSDSNDDIRDPAKKYYEALSHLMKWLESNPMETYALEQFKKHHTEGTYPGLGTVKKLSIMHHLQLMSSYLDWKNSL